MSHFWCPPSVPDQAVNMVLGSPLAGGDLKDVGSAEQQLLGVPVGHHLPRRPGEGVYFWQGEKGPPSSPTGIMRYPGKGDPPCHTSQVKRMPNMSASPFDISCYRLKGVPPHPILQVKGVPGSAHSPKLKASYHIMSPPCKWGPLS